MGHPVSERRFGRFYISGRMLKAAPAAVEAILSGMVVVRACYAFDRDGIEYSAASQHFDRLPDDGAESPFYEPTVKDLVGGKYHVTWSKKN